MKTLQNNYHVAVPTAFHEDENLNIEATFLHILNLYAKGVRSVLICGSTGEQHSLSLDEKLMLVSHIELDERLPEDLELIFGLASIRLLEALKLAKAIYKSKKIKAVLLGYPPYLVPTQEEAIYYTKTLLEELGGKPVILYNNPRRTGFDLEVSSILQLAENDSVIGMKEAGSVEKIPKLRSKLTKDFLIFAGGDINLEEKINIGFNSLSSIAGNVYPMEIKKYFMDLQQKEELLQQVKDSMNTKILTIFTQSPIAHVKNLITEAEGVNMGKCRSPLGCK